MTKRRASRTTRARLRAGALGFAFLAVGCAAGEPLRERAGPAADGPPEAGFLIVEVATVGMELDTGAPLALLHQGWDRVLPIWIGDAEAQAIARARGGVSVPRPQTHDLLASTLAALDGTLEEVRVHDLRDGTYIGSLRIRVGSEVREVDARPSDALALAVRTGARILVAERLVEADPAVDFLSADGERAIARIRGVTVSTPSDEEREHFGLGSDPAGVLVLHAASAIGAPGVQRGDLITSVEGSEVGSVVEFLARVSGLAPDLRISVRVLRGGEEIEVDLPPRRAPLQVT